VAFARTACRRSRPPAIIPERQLPPVKHENCRKQQDRCRADQLRFRRIGKSRDFKTSLHEGAQGFVLKS
jgi:hypothetical protein